MDNISKTSQLLNSIKTRGILGTLRWVRYGYLRVNKFIVFHKDLTQDFEYDLSAFLYKSIKLEVITLNQLDLIRNKTQNLPIEFFCDITHHFSTPCILYIDGEIAGINWAVHPEEPSRFLQLSKGDVEINYSTVLPNFRGERLGEALMAFQVLNLIERKQKRVFAVINANNIAQYKPMLSIGFQPVEVLTHFGLSRPKATLKYVK